ncbi:cold shock domain-containing protein [Achromobacter xylosoxidans]|uniref:cold shock domain-containing protein n=1 Tax=Alcaligenes xylosoxydans xylosoxydans TaxID=85698 RepID=UPI0034D39975
MATLVATRNTCFALISAIEEDFRGLIVALADAASLDKDIIPQDVRATAIKRLAVDTRTTPQDAQIADVDLLPYIDFADISKILESRIAKIAGNDEVWVTKMARALLALAGTRNRVCHSRPLEPDDLTKLLDFTNQFLRADCPFSFQAVPNARSRLRDDPGFVLTLQIPSYWSDKNRIHNNLPIPEFDDTGFVGRQSDRHSVMRLLRSHYPVITIVGEGGIGKTALALRCLYDILDDMDSPYDAIIWVSLKTTALTQAGVRQLTGAVTSTLGLLSEVVTQLGGGGERRMRSEDECINEIVEYLNLYRVVIAIDNLETISVGPLRDLMLRVPAQSKLLLTSRVGVGEFEARYPLEGLEEKAAVTLFRSLVNIFSVSALKKMDDGNIKGYCKKLFFNPLLIKWFVTSVARGGEPGVLTNKTGEDFGEALSFCFQNLFDKLGPSELDVINCLASARKPLTSAEIHFLLPGLENIKIEIALSALHNSSIVLRTKAGVDGFEYSLSESAQYFIDQASPPEPEFFRQIQGRLRELRLIFAQESLLQSRYDFDPFFVRCGEGRDERIAATYLRRGLDYSRRGDVANARLEITEAKRLAAQSAEVWRISALVEEKAGDQYSALQDYESAIELDPESVICRYCYGMFLMDDMEDLDGALQQLSTAEKRYKEAAPVLTAKAMALSKLGRYEEAAAIHEGLLPDLKHRERRWRLTGADQAADVFRRWARRLCEFKEYGVAEEKLKRSMGILLESAERGDVDEKLLRKAARALYEVFNIREFLSNESLIEYMLISAERIHDISGSMPLPINSELHSIVRGAEIQIEYRDRLLALDRQVIRSSHQGATIDAASLDPASFSLGQQFDGEIDHLPMEKNFGFIVCNEGRRWFFHETELVGDGFSDLVVGGRVKFSVGKNIQGLCAVAVHVVSRK